MGFHEHGHVIFGSKKFGKFFVILSGLTRTDSVGRVSVVAWEKATPAGRGSVWGLKQGLSSCGCALLLLAGIEWDRSGCDLLQIMSDKRRKGQCFTHPGRCLNSICV